MNYGFLIRNDRCIGCHACSTACKSENAVPLGVNRTWVKNVETGAYPDVRRTFQVTRCNHCANPPCVRICPVTAMYQRDDGIVEFDPDVCIGCKACLQACPYDAIYIDPESGTAAKCHFCAHRVELDLEPACVVVCPEHAIVAGDLDDPLSEISAMLAQHEVTVRKPEQGTSPKLFYVDGHEAALTPTATERAPTTFAWADVLPLDGHGGRGAGTGSGPITIDQGRMAGQMVQVFYNAQHRVPWHWPVPAYLVTKAVSTGLFLLLALGWVAGFFPFAPRPYLVAGFASLVFLGLTTALLVLDLERPERFLRILTRPQWRSWLARGAFVLIAFSGVAGAWWVLEAGAALGVLPAGVAAAARPLLLWAGMPLAVGAAVYTAFLFGQAEGRDLWQSRLLPLHLLVEAVLAGSAALVLLAPVLGGGAAYGAVGRVVLAVALLVDLALFLAEFARPHPTDVAAHAAESLLRGRFAGLFWWGVVVAGHALPLAILLLPGGGSGPPAWAAAALALGGLYAWEHAFVMAPQLVPNS